jgi:hypothetical protein
VIQPKLVQPKLVQYGRMDFRLGPTFALTPGVTSSRTVWKAYHRRPLAKSITRGPLLAAPAVARRRCAGSEAPAATHEKR